MLSSSLNIITTIQKYKVTNDINEVRMFPFKRVFDLKIRGFLSKPIIGEIFLIIATIAVTLSLIRKFYRRVGHPFRRLARGHSDFHHILFETLSTFLGHIYYSSINYMMSERFVLIIFYFCSIISITLLSAQVYKETLRNSYFYEMLSWNGLESSARDMWRQNFKDFNLCSILNCSYEWVLGYLFLKLPLSQTSLSFQQEWEGVWHQE